MEGLETSAGCLSETEHLRRRSQANLQPLANERTCALINDVSYLCAQQSSCVSKQAIVQPFKTGTSSDSLKHLNGNLISKIHGIHEDLVFPFRGGV